MAGVQSEAGQTLAASSRSGDHAQSSPQTLASSATPGSGLESSQVAGTLTRNPSSSKLNAKAPEFVPTKNSPAPRIADPRMVIGPTPPPSPPPMAPGMLHVYAAPVPPPGPPFHVPVPPSPPNPLHPSIQHQQFHHSQHNPHGHGHLQQQQPKRSNGGEQELVAGQSLQDATDKDYQSSEGSRIGLSEESFLKILNQVEYYFSDVNLATTDHLMRFINKDPEGYVPMSVVASFKKIKALINNISQLAAVLRNSTKLVVSEDGKKVKRINHLAGSDMEEVQCRIIVAENLPEDHCYQNLMKIFSAVGSVKSIRTCQPQTQNANSGATPASKSSKPDNVTYSSKVHAFVEYETVDVAEKAVAELNKEGDWRNGLRVRLLMKRQSKIHRSRSKRAGSEGEGTTEDESTSMSEQIQNVVDNSEQLGGHSQEQIEEQGNDKEGQKKVRTHGRGRGRGRGGSGSGPNHHHHQNNNRGAHHVGSPPTSFPLNDNDHSTVAKQPPPPGPRMPDGTRGFAVGRGKPVTA